MLISRSNIAPAIELINRLNDKSFNINLQYKLIKIRKKLVEEQEIYQEQIDSLTYYLEKNEDGSYVQLEDGAYKIKTEMKQEFNEKLKQMNSLQIQIPDYYLSLDELENFNLTLSELEALEPFIRD